jgi:hypothetical protein
MNATPSMNDDEMLALVRTTLTATRDSFDGIRMTRPVEELITGGRIRRARRTRRVRTALSCTVVGAVAVALIALNGSSRETGTSTVAYVTSRVEKALSTENLVYVGRSDSPIWGDYVTWAYGGRSRFVEYSSAAHYGMNGQLPSGGRELPYLASGTAVVGGKLVGAYVTYFDHRYSLWPLGPGPASACSASDALTMGSPTIPTTHWTAFIDATLACGAASVTGHVRIGGTQTTQITGKPVTVRLSPGYARTVRAQWATARWTLYVNPATYLPVRMYGSTETFGGSARSFTSSFITNVQWLAPTPANVAQTLVIIPRGFERVGSPADQ